MYLYETLTDYRKKDIYPFHMPGHKGRRKYFNENFHLMDVTELDETDNLHCPEGAIARSQERAAEVFGAKHTFFLVNGSTAGMLAAILAVSSKNDAVLLSRASHRSVHSGIALSGARPVYIYPKYTRFHIPGGITPREAAIALDSNPDVVALVITSPTYEGWVLPIREIALEVHRRGKLLIVDEAHGAHFKFHPLFPDTALLCGADIVVQSLHKTLPALGQTALLHSQVMPEHLRGMLALVQTSSPSYLFMSMMDKLIERLEKSEFDFDGHISQVLRLRRMLGGLKNIRLLGEEAVDGEGIIGYDLSRLTFYLDRLCIDGSGLNTLLADSYKIQMEMNGLRHIVGISTVADTASVYNRLIQAMRSIDRTQASDGEPTGIPPLEFPIPEIVYTPREAGQKDALIAPAEKCVGEVSSDWIIPYPPGIPLIAPGERISAEVLDHIHRYKSSGITVLGVYGDMLKIIKGV